MRVLLVSSRVSGDGKSMLHGPLPGRLFSRHPAGTHLRAAVGILAPKGLVLF